MPTARCAPGGGVDSRLSRLAIPSSGSLLYWSFMDAENATAVTAPAGRDRIVRFRLKSASHIPGVRPGRRDAISDHAEEGGTSENRTSSSLSRFARFARNTSKNAVHSASDHRGPSAEKFPAELVFDAGLGIFNFCAAAGGAVGDDSEEREGAFGERRERQRERRSERARARVFDAGAAKRHRREKQSEQGVLSVDRIPVAECQQSRVDGGKFFSTARGETTARSRPDLSDAPRWGTPGVRDARAVEATREGR